MRKKTGLVALSIISISALLLVTNILLGSILMYQSKNSMKSLIDSRMLDLANTASHMIDGDALAAIEKKDKGSKEYQDIYDTMAVYRDNTDLSYIYCIRAKGDNYFTFTIDTDLENPGEFDSPVVTTSALVKASKGTAAVDNEPYSDEWGKFYSAYSPIRSSSGEITEILAVDFSAAWYDEQLEAQTRAIFITCLCMVAVGILIVILTTQGFRRRLHMITAELAQIAMDVDELTMEINPDIHRSSAELESTDNVLELGRRISSIRKDLSSYRHNLHTQVNNMITSLSLDYRSVYFIDLDRDQGVCYQEHSKLNSGINRGDSFPYRQTLENYARYYVAEQYRSDFLDFIDPDNIREKLSHEQILTFRYIVMIGSMESYEMVRIAEAKSEHNPDDTAIHSIGMAFTDVDEETRRTMEHAQALADALDVAESASRAKTAFLSNMSHEIRTPLNAIIGLDHIALETSNLSDENREYLEKIGSSADHLLDIINDILDMSRIESGSATLSSIRFSLTDILSQVDVMIGAQCRDKNLNWNHTADENLERFYVGDAMKLKQILINILGNAVKFTDPGGNVSLRVNRISRTEEQSVLRFVISDTGIGMSPDYIPKLFTPFSQEDDTARTKYGSTGLGMAITKSMVDMMNGEINVESEKGAGTTFTVSVALTNTDQTADDETGSVAVHSASGAEPAELEGRRVLVAEDVEVNADIMEMILDMREITMEHAENGEIAVQMFTDSPQGYYDAILMDMRMPKMDGLQAARAIRVSSHPDAENIPIIALTANAFEEDVQRSLQAGIDKHLSKPVDPDELFNTLENLLA